MLKKIALEEHFITELLAPYAAGNRPTKDPGAFAELRRRLADFDALRLEAMDEAGIAVSVLSATVPGVQAEPDPGKAVDLARRANDELAVQVQKHPARYAGFAALPLQAPAAAADELERSIRQLGFLGAMVNGHTLGHYLDEDRFLPFWERAESLQAPIYLHPTDPTDWPAMFGGRPELNGSTWAWTVEAATHALRLVFSGIFERFPRLSLILGHMGETLPYLLWRLDNRARRADPALPPARLPSAVIKRHFWITTTGVCDPASLMTAIANLGEDHVMFSVDYPYESSKVAAEFLAAAPVSAEVRTKIAHGNAARLLRLSLPV
jgi:2,3-dihydroxybenzoate decarboxylase